MQSVAAAIRHLAIIAPPGNAHGHQNLFDFKHSAIACVAYHRWQAQGSPDGQADENWLAAEAELMPPMAVERRPVVIH